MVELGGRSGSSARSNRNATRNDQMYTERAFRRARHGHMASVKKWRANQILSRVMRWLTKLIMVNSTVSVSSPKGFRALGF
eukprot:1107805-Prorocentrum_minimum.AAC.1